MDIKKLKQRKADLIAQAKAIFSVADTAGRDLTAEERVQYDAIMDPKTGSVASLAGDIARAEALLETERNSPSGIAVVADNATKKPFASLGDQLGALAKSTLAVQSGRAHLADPRVMAALGASETVPSDGGMLVEPEFSGKVLEKIYSTGEIARRIEPLKMTSAKLYIPSVDEQSRQDGQRWGGILSYWLAEAQSYAGVKPKFNQVQLVANKLTCLMYATDELLEDTTMLESYAGRVVPDELAFKRDLAILSGSGAGQPLGIWNSPATIQQAIVSAETSISTADILNMYSRLFAPCRKDAFWAIHQALEPKLIPLTIGSPSLAQILLYQPPGGPMGNKYGSMLGLPVVPIEQASAPGVVGDITLISPDGYILADRNEVKADTSIHVAFLTGEVAFRWQIRFDGQPWWKQPLQPYYPAGGTAPPTQAAFVTLGARSGD
jgi:HK97 family phage major capsid protein